VRRDGRKLVRMYYDPNPLKPKPMPKPGDPKPMPDTPPEGPGR